jgi:hypothetical protein
MWRNWLCVRQNVRPVVSGSLLFSAQHFLQLILIKSIGCLLT